MKRTILILILITFITLSVTAAGENPAGSQLASQPYADVIKGSTRIYFTLKVVNYGSVLTVSCADGTVTTRNFKSGETPEFSLPANCADGSYTYELNVITIQPGNIRNQTVSTDSKRPTPPAIQSGHFTVKNGAIVTDTAGENLSTPLDVVHLDDVIITGSLCTGFDCVNGESFGFDTQILKENNLRIFFNDTSSTASFPSRNWRIVINDSANGGANYFAVEDADSARKVFTIEGGAPANSLYVEDYGRVGLGTSTPVVELHIKDSDTPTMRLEQDSSGGWSPQTWDLAGNESNFFIRDATNGSKLPFRIQPATPSSTLCLKSDGKVGIGTWSPEYSLEVETTGEHAMFVVQRTDGAEFKLAALANKVQIGARTNHEVRFTTNNEARMTITAGGNVGVGNTAPGHMLVVGTSGAYCDGGAWVDGSSRAFKENIRDLSETDAVNALQDLKPVRYNYKTNRSEEYLGFIAEDVPELVAMKDRRGMTAMDVVAVLTKVVQNQNQRIEEQSSTIRELQKRLERLEQKK